MEIRTLRYFLSVAREENMTRAAEQLHVTQPTLSKALKALEEELGKKLFTRHSFSISLTEEGTLLRNRAEDLISMADKIEQEFLSLDDLTGGELYFGLAESYQIRHLARALRKLKARYPALRYHITSGDTEQVTEKLDKGLLDFAVICSRPDAAKYRFLEFPEADCFGLIVPSGHPLAGKGAVTSAELAGQPLFCSEQSWENDIRPWAGDDFAREITGLDSFATLRQRMREGMQAYADQQAEEELKARLLDQLLTDGEVPEEQLKVAVDQQIQALEAQLARQGLTLDAYCQFTGRTKDQLREDCAPDAKKGILRQQVIGQIAAQEGVEADEASVMEAIRDICRQNNMTVEQLSAHLDEAAQSAIAQDRGEEA